MNLYTQCKIPVLRRKFKAFKARYDQTRGRSVNSVEQNYNTTEREAHAIVKGIKHFQTYLYERAFVIVTDHNSLKWRMQIKEPTGRFRPAQLVQ